LFVVITVIQITGTLMIAADTLPNLVKNTKVNMDI